MNLKGKRLLLMGGAAFIQDIKKYANEKEFTLIAVGKSKGAHSEASDEYYPIDTRDVDAISNIVKEKHIDGLFVGANECNIPPAIEVAERTGLHFYCTREQWEALSNKATLKQLLRKHGLPIIPEYYPSQDPQTIDYPVIVKPVDGSGARGISVCWQQNELPKAIEKAQNTSFTGRVIIEKFMQGMKDVFIHYRFQNGRAKVFNTFDKYADFSNGGFTGMPLIHKYPSSCLQSYLDKFDTKMQALFKELKITNGMLNIQGFVDQNDDFYFYETGYRLGGCQSYIFTDAVNHTNGLQYLINYELSGKMADYDILERDNPFFSKACCAEYIPLNPGFIKTMEGVTELRRIEGILNITQYCNVGDEIKQVGNLTQVCLRIHLMANTWKEIDDLLALIDDKLIILDENGTDMRMRHIRCLDDAIDHRIWGYDI